MRKQQGFTLIELVVVIIILGILAVVAAPKFVNLQSDARVSALQGLKGAIQGANSLVYSKAALAGQEAANPGTVTLSGDPSATPSTAVQVSTAFGYLDATIANFPIALDVSVTSIDKDVTTGSATAASGDWVAFSSSGSVKFWQNGAPAACFIRYTPAASAGAKPTLTDVPKTGC